MIAGRRRITLGILDDQQLLLDGLTAWLNTRPDEVEVVTTCRTWGDLMHHERRPVDVVLMAPHTGDVPVAVAIATLRMLGVATVVMSTSTEPALVRECISAGALGFVPKSEAATSILEAILAAHRGQTYLSASVATALMTGDRHPSAAPHLSTQELRVLVLYASGLPMKSVARRLDVGFETAKSYLGRVREKYSECGRDTHSKIDLRRRAIEDGLISAT